MVTEDPRGRRRRIFMAYGRSAHQQLTVFPLIRWCALCMIRVLDMHHPLGCVRLILWSPKNTSEEDLNSIEYGVMLLVTAGLKTYKFVCQLRTN